MRSSTDFLMKVFESAHEKRNRIIAGLLVLSLLVFAGVFWQLRYTGITMTSAPICGIEEHSHTEECSEYVLIDSAVSLEEAAAQYTVYVLTDTGYTALTDVAAEALEPQYDAYYQLSYACGIDEHIHSTSCYCDPTADVENVEYWTTTLPSLEGVWTKDVLAIANEQIGYTESEKNFELDEDSGERMGYTRYGQWYSNPYGKWDSMFVCFCLYYAGVTEDYIPYNSGAYAWTVELAEAGLFSAGSSGISEADIVFFDTDLDGDADRSAIVESVNEDGSITVIEGDSFVGTEAADKVQRVIYTDLTNIFGYASIPTQPEPEAAPVMYSVMLTSNEAATVAEVVNDFSGYVSSNGIGGLIYENGTYVIKDYTCQFKNTAEYDDEGNVVNTDEVLTQAFIQAANYTYYYQLPDDIKISELNAAKTYDLWDETGTIKTGYFNLVHATDADGNVLYDADGEPIWSVKITFIKDYIDNTLLPGQGLTGKFAFDANLGEDAWQEDGSVNVPVNGGVINVPSSDIVYDENTSDETAETKNYDVTVSKTGYYDATSDSIKYSITVYSNKGTPAGADNVITLTDTITTNNGVAITLPVEEEDFTVTKYVYTTGSSVDSVTGTLVDSSSYSATFPSEGSELFEVKLPPIIDKTPDGEDDTNDQYTTAYVIEYSVSLSDVSGNTSYSPNNKIELETSDATLNENLTVQGSETVTVYKDMISKTVSDNGDGTVTWTIKINESGANINGYLLTDTMLKDVVTVSTSESGETVFSGTENVSISNSSGYQWTVDENGEPAIEFIELQEGTGANRNSYTIVYTTDKQDKAWGYTPVKNVAEIGPADGSESSRAEIGYYPATSGVAKSFVSATDIGDGKQELEWNISIEVPESGIPANSYVSDYFTKNGSIDTATHYATWTQMQELMALLEDGISVNRSTEKFTDFTFILIANGFYDSYYYNKSENQWYYNSWGSSNLQDYTKADEPSSLNFTGFRILFTSELDADVYGSGYIDITYDTTIAIPDGTTEYIAQNEVKKDSGDYYIAKYTYTEKVDVPKVTKTDGSNNSSDTTVYINKGNTAELTWNVKVTIPDDYVAGTPIVVKDTVPNGLTLSNVTVRYRNQWNDGDLNAAGVINGSSISFDCGHYDENNNYIWAADTTSVTGTITENEVTINVNDATNLNISGQNYFTIVYKFTVDDFNAEDTHTESYIFEKYTNNVSVEFNGEVCDSDSQSQTVYKVIQDESSGDDGGDSPTGSYPSAKRSEVAEGNNVVVLNYTVDVNPAKADLAEDSDVTTLTDTLSYYKKYYEHYHSDIYDEETNTTTWFSGNVELFAELMTVSLYYPEMDENGNIIYYDDEALTVVSTDAYGYMKPDTSNPVPQNLWSWKYTEVDTENNGSVYCEATIEFTVRDQQAYVIQYSYKLSADNDNADFADFGIYKNVNNTFTAADGTKYSKYNSGYFKKQSGGGSTETTENYNIIKVDSDNYGETLGGAIFTVYEYNGSQFVETEHTYTTKDDGIVTVNATQGIYDVNTAYYLVETTAPAKYQLPANPTKYYFYFPDSESSVSMMPSDFLTNSEYGNKHTFGTRSMNVFAGNELSEITSITLTKSWKDGSGNDMSVTSGSVTGTIYQVASTVRLAEGTGNAGGSGENIETAMVLNTFLRYQDVDVSDENGKVQYHEIGDPMLNDDGSQMTDEAGNLLYYTAREVIFDGDKSTWVTLEYPRTISVDEAATYEFTYTVPFSDILKYLPEWWKQFKADPKTAGDAPNVYLQIDGLYAMLKAAGYDEDDVKIDVTTKMDGAEVPNSARVNVDNDEFQINVYNPWSELWTDPNALKTWSDTFEVTLSVTIPDLSKDRTLSFALEDDANKAGQSDYNTGTADYEFAIGTAVDVKMLLANNMSNWGITTALLELTTGEATQSFTGTEATESLSDGKYYHSYNFDNILLDNDAAISGSLGNSEITDFVFVAVESADAYTDAELRAFAEQNYNKLVVYVVYDETPEEDGSITVPSYSNLDDTYVVYDQPYKTFTISEDNNWETTISDLPLVGTYNGVTVYYTYYVKEDPVSGYDDSYSNITVYDGTTSNTITLKDAGDITITNTSAQTFELPETGSIGTVLLTVNALLFMVVPIMYLFRRRETVGGEE